MKYFKVVNLYILILISFVFFLSGCEQIAPKPSLEKAKASFNTVIPGANVKSIDPTPVKGIYELIVEDNGRLGVVYMSRDTKYIFTGSLLDTVNGEDMTTERLYDITKVDFNTIPLANSITLGAKDGAQKIFVFSDPSCLPCALYHEELKKVVRENDDITVYLKLFALPNVYPKSYEKARAIYCAKSNEEALKRMDALYAAEDIPYPDCKTGAVDENMALASRLKIQLSPTTIFPNGVKIMKAIRAKDFLKQLEKRGGKPTLAKKAPSQAPAGPEVKMEKEDNKD